MDAKNPLRGAVAERYGSCARFAAKLGWSQRKTRDIVSGRQIATARDISQMADALQVSEPSEFMRVFFDSKSTM